MRKLRTKRHNYLDCPEQQKKKKPRTRNILINLRIAWNKR